MSDFDTRIDEIMTQIEHLDLEKTQLLEKIKKVEQEKIDVMEVEFQQRYNISSESVRTSYISRLSNLSASCLRGHYVKYDSLDSTSQNVINPGASHIYLLPENYEAAKLSQAEIDAFAVIDRIVLIDPKSHLEQWGN